jgi:hypothetical protein
LYHAELLVCFDWVCTIYFCVGCNHFFDVGFEFALGFGGGTHCRILFACLLWIGLMGFVQFIFVLIAIVSSMLVLSLLGFDGGAHRKFFCMFAWFALDFVVWTSEYYISTYIQDVILYILVGLSHKIKIKWLGTCNITIAIDAITHEKVSNRISIQ